MLTMTEKVPAGQTGTDYQEGTVPVKQYWNPYVSGVALGLVLLSAFVIMGRGLGASGAFSTFVSVGVNSIAPEHAQSNEAIKGYLGDGTVSPFKEWLVFEVLGVFVGGIISGLVSGRLKKRIEKGPRIGNRQRLVYAVAGGVLMGIGARLGRGCTSGQALTGGAMLNLGSWAFMLSVFAGAYALAYFMRRQWL
ncbi:MAG: YeeE/YedE thiosulfate transporter family protein [Syntrophomonadaceae bacterium]